MGSRNFRQANNHENNSSRHPYSADQNTIFKVVLFTYFLVYLRGLSMGDSWEDEDFEPVILPTAASSSASKPVAASASILPPKPPQAEEDEDEDEGASWEDDDFQAPDLLATIKSNHLQRDDDEEDLVYEELNKKDFGGKPPSKVAEALAKKSAAEEASILAQIKNGPQKNETSEQRKLRERKQQVNYPTLSTTLFILLS